MNILVVEGTFPWPEKDGPSIRVANLVRALARLGDVDFFLLPRWGTQSVTVVPAGEPVTRFGKAPCAPGKGPRSDRLRQLAWLLMGTHPYSIARRDYSAVRSAFLAWARPRYDVVWMGRAHTYVPLAGLIDEPVVVDLDDLEDRKIDVWLDAASQTGRSSSGHGRAAIPAICRRSGALMFNATNRRRWRSLQRRIAAGADAVVVCSEIDRGRLAVSNSVVVPNGYVPPEQEPTGRENPHNPPTLMMVGALGYGPNIDAARFLATEVLPRVRTEFSTTQIRLVGEYNRRVEDLGFLDGVTLTGRVRDITTELSRADIAAVPIRVGSGTRVKILEAFAHRIPVVSTTLGCEGLDVADSRHLLVADDADAFASSCVALLRDRALRSRLTDSAHDLYWRRYRWSVIAPSVVELVRGVAANSKGARSASRRRRRRARGTSETEQSNA